MAEPRNGGAGVRLASIVAIAFGSLALAAPPALGASHGLTATITGSGANALSGPSDVALDPSTHDIYVTDPGNYRVEKFDSSGNFLLMFGGNVNSGTGNASVCTNAGPPTNVCQAGTSSSSPGSFQSPAYLAIDNSGGPSAGDVYVSDPSTHLVQKFNSTGHIVTNWGVGGQLDGTGTPFDGGGDGFPQFGVAGIAVDSKTGNLWAGFGSSAGILEYTQDGTFIDFTFGGGNGAGLKFDSAGNIRTSSGTGFNFDPTVGDLYLDTGADIEHYGVNCCDLLDSFGSGDLSGSSGVAVDGVSHNVYVANAGANDVAVFGDIRPIVTTGAPTDVTDSSLTLTGHIDPATHGDITECHFEYGFDNSYGTSVPCTPDPASSNFTGPTDVTATIGGFSADTHDHYRLVVTNAAGSTGSSKDQIFFTNATPSIDSLSADNLTATSADINARVNPDGLDTTYRIEYGTTIAYGQAAPLPDGTLSASNADQAISVHLDNLTPHVVYHFRLIATNADGTTTSVNHTFNFFPPSCPNQNVRQQTQANYLPDCRAYELVSPGDANGTQLYPGGPNTGHATNPSRFSFVGQWGTLPNSGGSPIDGRGDLYVATRTDTGWVSRYVGLPANQASIDGGPPMGLPASVNSNTDEPFGLGQTAGMAFATQYPDRIQNSVITDRGMNAFLVFNDGNPGIGALNDGDKSDPTPTASNAPYVFGADGSLRDRWPTNLGAVPDGSYPTGLTMVPHGGFATPGEQPAQAAPGGDRALTCPTAIVDTNGDPLPAGSDLTKGNDVQNYCPGDVTASADLSHFVFATEWNVFAPGGRLGAPGSVYDNETAAGTLAVASKTPAGADIPSEPGDQFGDPLQTPAVSADGSHILIAAGGTGPCGSSTCPLGQSCGPTVASAGLHTRCAMQPSHLYMRVNGALTYDVSQGYDVNYVGATPDGSRVYFTTDQQLTPDDTDTSTDLYMWSETTDSLTLVSKGTGGAGNSDACNSTFTAKCGVLTYSQISYCQLHSNLGGNCHSDNSIAATNGDIYFFSPEQLVGTRGVANRENLYDYRNGVLQYVTTFTTGSFCNSSNVFTTCSDTPIARMQVSPDDSHMAFLTASPVTPYDNAGHLEMYTYDPATEKVACASCIPSGAPATSDAGASENGLFMTDDGRVFFTTDDALVHTDTNQAQDVYEFVDGHAQLITQGTGDTRREGTNTILVQFNLSGLIGVSANGTDVYFSTNQTLVPQDQNGLFLKFYDARAGGGFPAPPPPPRLHRSRRMPRLRQLGSGRPPERHRGQPRRRRQRLPRGRAPPQKTPQARQQAPSRSSRQCQSWGS
jgi:hypothetical protein